MKNLLCLLLLISLTSYSQSKNETGKSTVIAKKLLIQDNITCNYIITNNVIEVTGINSQEQLFEMKKSLFLNNNKIIK